MYLYEKHCPFDEEEYDLICAGIPAKKEEVVK